MSDIDTSELRALLAAATRGPWEPWGHAEPEPGCRCLSCYQPSWAWEIDRIDGPACESSTCDHVMHIRYADAALIAAAVNALPALLDRLEELERLVIGDGIEELEDQDRREGAGVRPNDQGGTGR